MQIAQKILLKYEYFKFIPKNNFEKKFSLYSIMSTVNFSIKFLNILIIPTNWIKRIVFLGTYMLQKINFPSS